MHILDLTLDRPEENLALDEALLELAEQAGQPTEVLRFWEPRDPLVVVGRASRVAEEVHLPACQSHGIPVLRRCSGGAAIVTGPGCLMYAVVLSYDLRPHLRMIDQAHCFVLSRVAEAVGWLVDCVQLKGTSDLAHRDRKFSGNSLRCKRTHLLYHGTLLYDFPLDMISTCLGQPPRQPDYRQQREHAEFVTNLSVAPQSLKQCLVDSWQAHQPLASWPRQLVGQLVAQRYCRADWNLGR